MTAHNEKSIQSQAAVSESLHDHSLVHPDLRTLHRDIIYRSLSNYPKHADAGQDLVLQTETIQRKIEGTFLPFNEKELSERWTNQEFRSRQLRLIRDIGIDSLILLTGNPGGICYKSKIFKDFLNCDLVEQILIDADKLAMDVWVGMPHVEIAWMLQQPDALNRLAEIGGQLLEEIHQNYGHHKSFYGWYIPYELCNVFIQWNGSERHLPQWINKLATRCKELSPNRPVAIAPYFTTVDGPQEFRRLWAQVAAQLDAVDTIMMQDSVGIFKEDRLREIPLYFSILQDICHEHGKQLWADIETFDQQHGIPLDEMAWSAQPPSNERVIRQLEAVSPYVERIVTFTFCEYMNPESGPQARRFYEDYRDYVAQTFLR